jgi:hypothetical protein
VRTIIDIAILAWAASLAWVAQNADLGAMSKILALEYAWDQAQERGDIKARSAIFDNSLMFVDYDGQVLTKTEYLARGKVGFVAPSANRDRIDERADVWDDRDRGWSLPGQGGWRMESHTSDAGVLSTPGSWWMGHGYASPPRQQRSRTESAWPALPRTLSIARPAD